MGDAPRASEQPKEAVDLLTPEELALLTAEEVDQYRQLIEAAEREADLADVSQGLTLDLADFHVKRGPSLNRKHHWSGIFITTTFASG